MPKIKLYFLITLYLLSVSEPVSAKVYKWVDENGSVHFTDKPPENSNIDIEELKIKTNSIGSYVKMPKVEDYVPIKNRLGVNSKSVLLEYASIDLSNASDINTVVGQAFKFTKKGEMLVADFYRGNKNNINPLTCVRDGDLNLSNANYIMKLVNFIDPFQDVLKGNNYNVVSQGDKRFTMQKIASSDLSLGATVKEIKLAHCGRSSASNLNSYTQNSSYIKVHWEVFDNLSRKVVYEIDTEGSDNHLKSVPRMNGAATSFGMAFRQSVEGLLSEQAFVDILTNKISKNHIDIHSEYVEPLEGVDLNYGHSNTNFSGQINKIKQAAATIRTTSGHGSGFVINQSGYVITNHHVVNQSRQLMVIIQGKEYIASLIKSDPQRDVALLKIIGDYLGGSVNISTESAKLGEKIYVIGTPLDEALDFTITGGIISANRKLEGKRFYQTDAAVNPGNSGGPVFNEYGNVIGITVSGFFTENGGSKNINYLIPIDAALNTLGIK